MTAPAPHQTPEVSSVVAAGHQVLPSPTPAVIAKVAIAFCAVLLAWIGPARLAEAARRNASTGQRGVCHSHDYIDANEAMAQAFKECGFSTFIEQDGELHLPDRTLEVWNAAWHLAKSVGFKAEEILATSGN